MEAASRGAINSRNNGDDNNDDEEEVSLFLFWPHCLHRSLSARAQMLAAAAQGKVTQEGKPLANVQVVLTNLDMGKVYKTKTDQKGVFAVTGMVYGGYQVDVLGDKGEKLFTQKAAVAASDAASIIAIDIPKGGMQAGQQVWSARSSRS